MCVSDDRATSRNKPVRVRVRSDGAACLSEESLGVCACVCDCVCVSAGEGSGDITSSRRLTSPPTPTLLSALLTHSPTHHTPSHPIASLDDVRPPTTDFTGNFTFCRFPYMTFIAPAFQKDFKISRFLLSQSRFQSSNTLLRSPSRESLTSQAVSRLSTTRTCVCVGEVANALCCACRCFFSTLAAIRGKRQVLFLSVTFFFIRIISCAFSNNFAWTLL